MPVMLHSVAPTTFAAFSIAAVTQRAYYAPACCASKSKPCCAFFAVQLVFVLPVVSFAAERDSGPIPEHAGRGSEPGTVANSQVQLHQLQQPGTVATTKYSCKSRQALTLTTAYYSHMRKEELHRSGCGVVHRCPRPRSTLCS